MAFCDRLPPAEREHANRTIPPVEEGMDMLAGCECFSVVDMMPAYWPVPTEDDGSIERTAFLTHDRLFSGCAHPSA